MKFNKIALIGAGAVGAYFIYGFSELEGVDFCVIAEGERKERLIRDGITINEKVFRPAIKEPSEARGADLLLVCTKYNALKGCLDMIEKVVDDHTVVVSFLNGIDSEEIIGERIGNAHMLYSVARISSERRDGKITFVPETTIGMSIGEKGISEPTDRTLAFANLMERAGLKYFIEKDIILDEWHKFSMNIIYNLPQAVLSVGFGAYFDSEYVAKLRDKMYEEVCRVAMAEGVDLGGQGSWRDECVDAARFSTLQDLDAKRQTEVDMFTGTLLRLAKIHGIPVPFCECIHYEIKALEEKNSGKFDY